VQAVQAAWPSDEKVPARHGVQLAALSPADDPARHVVQVATATGPEAVPARQSEHAVAPAAAWLSALLEPAFV
jgi:hypothetical protein